jgi:hypothetical protein
MGSTTASCGSGYRRARVVRAFCDALASTVVGSLATGVASRTQVSGGRGAPPHASNDDTEEVV